MVQGEADRSWQEECTGNLSEAVASGRAGPEKWREFRRGIAEQRRIIIADVSFANESLKGFDFTNCYFARVSFTGANLSDANFYQAIFRNCNATDANIEGANFRYSDMRADGLIIPKAKFDQLTNFEVRADLLPDNLDRGLRQAAARAAQERRWRNRRSYSPLVQAMMWLTQYGYSVRRLAYLGVGIILAVSVVFRSLGQGWASALLASTSYFLGLDAPYGGALHAIGLVEGFLGLLFFTVLTAILVSLFLKRHDPPSGP